jgi:hypothetical protein
MNMNATEVQKAKDCKTKADFVKFLLQGVDDGTFNVVGYTSAWMKNGQSNIRKMTITIEDLHFDKKGRRIKPEEWHGTKP